MDPKINAPTPTPDSSDMESKLNQILQMLQLQQDRINAIESKQIFTSPIRRESSSEDEINYKSNLFGFTRKKDQLVISGDSEEEDYKLQQKKPKRSSMLRQHHGSDRVSVTTFQNQPSFENIKMSKLTVSEALNFWTAVNKYEAMYNIPLKAATLVEDHVRKTIITKNHNILETDEQFFNLANDQIRKLVQKSIRPTDRHMFAKQLTDAVFFKSNDKFVPTVINFQDFFTRLSTFRREFEDVFEFLSFNNSKNIPRLDNKDDGIIRVFISKIPADYGNRVYQQLPSTKFDVLSDFLEAFFAIAQRHFEMSKQAKELYSYLPSQNSHPIGNKLSTPFQSTRLQNLLQNTVSVEFDTKDEIAPVDDIAEDRKMTPQELDDFENEQSEQLDQDLGLSLNASNPVQLLRRPQPARPIHRTGCLKMLLNGYCDRPQCGFSHEHAQLEESAREMEVKLRARPFINKSAQGAPRRPPPEPPPLSNMSTVKFLQAMIGDSTIIESVRQESVLVFGSNNLHCKVVALLDSGALQASYIRSSIIDKHRDSLGPSLVPAHGRVVLANQVTGIDITEMLKANMYMKSPSGVDYYFQVDLLIMQDLAEDVILGLPTIISSLLPLFVENLSQAKLRLESSTEVEGNLLKFNQIIQQPWQQPLEEEAPEDEDIPNPCSFAAPLQYMMMSREEAINQLYLEMDDHVAPEFAQSTKVLDLIKDIGIDVFIPVKWEGIKGVPPIEFNWKEGMPARVKPNPRPLNPKLYENAKLEFDRLKTYFYQKSDSPIASCLVIAPKATKPFIRFCGDYATMVNKFIETGNYPIPHVFHSLEKISKFKVFLDIDLTNSFHQFLLGEKTRRLLSVQTPWGQFEPLFLPEGVPPASGILQQTMVEIFSDFESWTIAIFDNLLVLCNNYEDAYVKLEKILLRCKERNLVLKFSKTFLGFSSVDFFGYRCEYGSYGLTDKRKASIKEIPFPKSLKEMQRFLGCAIFFTKFMPNFSILTAHLHDMTRKDFSWDRSSWTRDYQGIFEAFKDELLKATSLYYPDYNLEWILRVDASESGVGFVLIQVSTDGINQPIIFGSKKFTSASSRWDMFCKEAFAQYFGIKSCEYWLRGKIFTLEGDHANLQWIEQSLVPKVIRWRIYMQGFSFKFNHIAGRTNIIADWQSRLFNVSLESDAIPTFHTRLEMLQSVHGGRSAHLGARKTWLLLNSKYPGHGISFAEVSEYISECTTCQKVRHSMTEVLVPIVRHLKNPGPRRVVGIDYLSLAKDKNGNIGVYVTRDHHSKLIQLYPTSNQSALNAATALFIYAITYGLFDTVMTDPGSEFTSSMLETLNAWFGVHHRISLTDRHQSNGVEGGNKEILRHLRALVCDERIKDRWSDPTVIGWISFIMNSFNDSESGASPYDLTFGSKARKNFDFPKNVLDRSNASDFLKLLDDDLDTIRSAALTYQQDQVNKRVDSDFKQNQFQAGDFVLFRHSDSKPLPDKLIGKYSGPYTVIKQEKNDVDCRHCALGKISTFHVENLKLFIGDASEAFKIAMADADQYEVDVFLAYRGDPMKRKQMQFLVRFRDSSEVWLPWSEDLFATIAYEDYCRSVSALFPLLYRLQELKIIIKELNLKPINEVQPDDVAYVDLRSYGSDWYEGLNLPNADFASYVLLCTYGQWQSPQHLKIELRCPLFKEKYEVDHVYVKQHGMCSELLPTMTLVNLDFAKTYPQVLPKNWKKLPDLN